MVNVNFCQLIAKQNHSCSLCLLNFLTRRYSPLRGPTSRIGGLRPLAKFFFLIQKIQKKYQTNQQNPKKIQKKKKMKIYEWLWCDSSDCSQVIKVSCPRSGMYISGGLCSLKVLQFSILCKVACEVDTAGATCGHHRLSSDAVGGAVCTSLHSALADGRRSDMDRPRTDNPQVLIRHKDVRPSSPQKNHLKENKKNEERKKLPKKEKKNAILLVSNIRRTRFDQSSPAQPISESRGGSTSVTDDWTDKRTNGQTNGRTNEGNPCV